MKSVDICSGVENVAEQKPINYIMENLSHKFVCRHLNTVIRASFLTYFTDKNHSQFWIRANDKEVEDDWVWELEKSKLLFSDWDVGQPNNYHDDEDCGTIRWNGSLYKWNDDKCQNRYLFICEK